jgi:hypothetical protein
MRVRSLINCLAVCAALCASLAAVANAEVESLGRMLMRCDGKSAEPQFCADIRAKLMQRCAEKSLARDFSSLSDSCAEMVKKEMAEVAAKLMSEELLSETTGAYPRLGQQAGGPCDDEKELSVDRALKEACDEREARKREATPKAR